MKTYTTLFLFFLSTLLCKAQTNNVLSTTDSKVNDKINQLNKGKIDTIICYYVDCVGSEHAMPPDSCLAFDIKYLLWSKNGKYYIQRFDECKEYSSAVTGSFSFKLLENHYSEIQKSKLKYPKYKMRVNGKLDVYYTYIDHSCHNIIEIHTNDKILRKDIDDYALETKYDDEKHLNRNFDSNQKSILNKLKIVIERDVDVYNQNH